MNDLLFEMEKEFGKTISPKVQEVVQDDLKNVAQIAEKIEDEQKYIADLERDLKAAKRNLLKLTDEDLPAAMGEANLKAFTLQNGSKVEIKNIYGVSILVEQRPSAHAWLRENGYGDLVKNVISCSFGMGEDRQAYDFKALAIKNKVPVTQQESVHPSTLKAWVKERIEKGEETGPSEIFDVYVGQRAVIKGDK
tara:strand:+ start:13074 stop:13655 length:582 start_codon:yes stop_codon:yes gene_type:complete